MRSPGLRWTLAAATIAISAASCAMVDDASEPVETADESRVTVTASQDARSEPGTALPGGSVAPAAPATASTTSSTIPTIPSPASADLLRQERLYVRPEPLGPLARANGVRPSLLPPGDHTTDVLGVEVTLRLDRWWRLDNEDPGSFALTRPDAPIDAGFPAVLFERPVGLALPELVHDENLLPGEYPVPPEELGSWLEEVSQITVLATGDAAAGDRIGRWYEIDVDPYAGPTNSNCSPGRCVHAWWSGSSVSITARDMESVRYYEFPDPAGPIFVLVAAADDEFDEWARIADELIRTATFGPSAPHPVPERVSVGIARSLQPGEAWRFITFPGVVITPEEHSIAFQRPGKLIVQPWNPLVDRGEPSIVRPLQDADGHALRTLDEVIDVLDASTLTRRADEMIFDTKAAVFSGVSEEPIFRRVAVEEGHRAEFAQWPDLENVHVWAFESPIGPLLLAGESARENRLDTAIERARVLADLIVFDCADESCATERSTTACATESCDASDESVG